MARQISHTECHNVSESEILRHINRYDELFIPNGDSFRDFRGRRLFDVNLQSAAGIEHYETKTRTESAIYGPSRVGAKRCSKNHQRKRWEKIGR